jgi:hypothetical protein
LFHQLRGWVSRTAEKATIAVGNLREVTEGMGIAESKLFSSLSKPFSPPSPLFRAYPSIHRHHSCILSTLYEEKM